MLLTPSPSFMPKVAGGGSWTPASLGTALVAWYKADANVYNDAGTTLATNGQTVQQWNDQSGNGFNLSQATAGNRPTYQSAGYNSLPAVNFTSASSTVLISSVIASALTSKTTSSVFVVGQATSLAGNARLVCFVNGIGSDFQTGMIWIMGASGTSVEAYENGALSSGTVSTSTNYRLGSVLDGTNHTLYVNNVGQTPVAYTAALPSGSHGYIGVGGGVTSSDGISVSALSGNWSGPVAEVVVTNTALSSTDRSNLDTYFTGKWGT